jgi:hypothetical protein
MARQSRKKRQSDLVNLVSVLTSEQTQPLIFHTLGRIARLPGLSGVRTSENQITPGAQLYTPVPYQWAHHNYCGEPQLYTPVPYQWANSVLCSPVTNVLLTCC